MRRLLTVVHYPIFGGPHNHIIRLAKPLEQRGWSTIALLPNDPGNAAERISDAGVRVIQVKLHRLRSRPDPALHGRYLLNFGGDIARVRRIIRQEQIDVVRLMGLVNPQTAIAAHLEGVPVVWQITDSRPAHFIRRAYMPMVNSLADSILFTGKRLVQLHGGESALRVPWFIYYPPVETARFKPDSAIRIETRRRLGIPVEAPVVGTVANLNPQKGIEQFIRIAAVLHRRMPDCWYVVVGERYATHREYWARLQAELVTSGVPRNHMLFVGGTGNPELFYPAMDIKLITSKLRSEGIPTTAVEAMSCGVPVIASNVGAVCEVVEDAVTGFLVPPSDAEASADAALRLLNDHALRHHMGEASRRAAVDKYDLSACVNSIEEALSSAVLTHERGKHSGVR